MLDSAGHEFWDPEADAACFETIKANLRPEIPVIELASNINDPEFAERVAETLLGMLREPAPARRRAALAGPGR